MSPGGYSYFYNNTDTRPGDLFRGQAVILRSRRGNTYPRRLFVRDGKYNRDVLVYGDGTCSRNGSPDAEASWLVMGKPLEEDQYIDSDDAISNQSEVRSGELEDGFVPTAPRAKMMGVIEALRWIIPVCSQFRYVVIGTDLELIVKAMSGWISDWEENGWRTSQGHETQNVDLWKTLLRTVNEVERHGAKVKFWKVPRIKGPRT